MIVSKYIIDSGAEFNNLDDATTQQLIDEIILSIEVLNTTEDAVAGTLAYLRKNIGIEDEIEHWRMNTQE